MQLRFLTQFGGHSKQAHLKYLVNNGDLFAIQGILTMPAKKLPVGDVDFENSVALAEN